MTDEKLHPNDDRSIKKNIMFFDLPISIEILKGETKYSKKLDGTVWSRVMRCDYGYFDNIVSNDGEFLDCYIVNDGISNNEYVYSVDQYTINEEGHEFDEVKIIVGVNSILEAKSVYLRHCQSPECMGDVKTIHINDIRKLHVES